jgi:prefoldin subunit 4
MPHSQALKRLERDQQEADQQFTRVEDQVEEIESQMKALKVVLYAKFGKAINLEE